MCDIRSFINAINESVIFSATALMTKQWFFSLSSCGIHLIIRDDLSLRFTVFLTQNTTTINSWVALSSILFYFNAFFFEKKNKTSEMKLADIYRCVRSLKFSCILVLQKISLRLAFSPILSIYWPNDWFPFNSIAKQRKTEIAAKKLKSLFHCHALILLSVCSFFAFLMFHSAPHTKKCKINIFF